MTIDALITKIAQVLTYKKDTLPTNATGFFYVRNGFLYLVTNRHVVRDDPTKHEPDALHVKLHTDPRDLTKNHELTLPLYEKDQPLWKEHPIHGTKADLVLVPVNDPRVLGQYFVSAFEPADVLASDQTLPVGQDVLIVGFPLGFHDTLHNLPVVRNATVASLFGYPFKGDPYFLTDARLHRGTSGSPVIAKLPRRTEVVGEFKPAWHLLGVHSAALDVSNRDPSQDEPLGLNTAWYADLIEQIAAAHEPKATEVAAAS